MFSLTNKERLIVKTKLIQSRGSSRFTVHHISYSDVSLVMTRLIEIWDSFDCV